MVISGQDEGKHSYTSHKSTKCSPEVNNIIGGGNYLYCALSLEVCIMQILYKEIHTQIVDFVCQHHEPFSQYNGQNLGEYLRQKHASAQVMGFRCGGLSGSNLAANNNDHLHSLRQDYRKVAVVQSAFSVAGTN